MPKTVRTIETITELPTPPPYPEISRAEFIALMMDGFAVTFGLTLTEAWQALFAEHRASLQRRVDAADRRAIRKAEIWARKRREAKAA